MLASGSSPSCKSDIRHAASTNTAITSNSDSSNSVFAKVEQRLEEFVKKDNGNGNGKKAKDKKKEEVDE